MSNYNIEEELSHKKAAIYIRVSTQYQVDKDSLLVQRRELEAYAEIVLGIKDYVVFEDPGFSAKNTDRPDYQNMMIRIRTGEFTHLLVWKIDRISRNLLDFAEMYKELKNLGVTFVSKNEQFDTSSAIGEAMLKIILVFAELERNITSERVSAVMLSRANNGQWNGGRIPYGYDYDKETKEFSVNKDEASIIRKIYELYEIYQSVIYISKYLNENKITTRAGKEWSGATVHSILTNIFYLGSYKYNVHKEGSGYKLKKESEWIIVPDHHEPIVSTETFERIQNTLHKKRTYDIVEGQTFVRKNIHIFAGLIRCGVCGANMAAHSDRVRSNGWKPSMYLCGSKNKNNDCGNKYISDIVLGPFVFNYIANLMRLKKIISTKTSLSTVENYLLKGKIFENVKSINQDDLKKTKDVFLSKNTSMPYQPVEITAEETISEKSILEDKKRKAEIALNRLRSLFLYGESDMPEKDYLVERKSILDNLESINKRLNEIKVSEETNPISDDDFIKKASYFIMAEKLLSDGYIDYEKYIRTIDPIVPRNFIKSIISKIEVADGNIISIEFKNGTIHHFNYK